MEDRLYKFARLVDAGSFTKAAQAMHISQPALTTAIKKLERELHAELLVRDSHTFKITAAGGIAYAAAKEMNSQARNLKLRLAEASTQKVQLHLGMIDSVADLLFVHSDNLHELEEATHLSLTVDNTSKLITYVEHDELDIAFIAKPASLASSLTAIELGLEPLLLVSHVSQTSKIRKGLAGNQLDQFLSYNQNSMTQRLVSSFFERHSIEAHPVFHSTSPEIMLQLVLAGRGSAVLPYLLVAQHLKNGELSTQAVGNEPVIARTIVGIHRDGRRMPDPVMGLLANTRAQLGQQMQAAQG
jgi:DNA-binding transcriptional LysR family regulator